MILLTIAMILIYAGFTIGIFKLLWDVGPWLFMLVDAGVFILFIALIIKLIAAI